MPRLNKNLNRIPDAHAEEDKNTPGEDSGDQRENIEETQTGGEAPPPPDASRKRRK
jgi:hypothetical protein